MKALKNSLRIAGGFLAASAMGIPFCTFAGISLVFAPAIGVGLVLLLDATAR